MTGCLCAVGYVRCDVAGAGAGRGARARARPHARSVLSVHD